MLSRSDNPTLIDLLKHAAEQNPGGLCLSMDGVKCSFSDLYQGALKRAECFINLGVQNGDKVGILLPNGIEYLEIFYGAMLAGCIPVTINNRYKVAELKYVLSHGDVRFLFTSAAEETNFLNTLNEAFSDLDDTQNSQNLSDAPVLEKIYIVENPPNSDISDTSFLSNLNKGNFNPPLIKSDDIAFIMFTSGTTANPKACCLSHRSVVGNGFAQVERWKMTEEDRMYDPLPFFHMSAILPLTASICSMSSLYATRYFSADEAVETFINDEITIGFIAFPTLTNEIINHPKFDGAALSSVRLVNNVAPISTLEIYDKSFEHGVGVSAFGMTEAGGVICYGDVDDSLEKRLNSCGKPFPGIEVRISDPENPSEVLGANQKGEIQIRGYSLFEGYYKDEEATKNAMTADGWYRSGDLGALDKDGYLSYLGRWKDMLKIGGENVAALEIESHINTHPGVILSQVVGIEDERYDEVAAVFIEAVPGANVSSQDIIDYCKGQISNFKIPRYVVFVNEWPMSATKIQKFKLKSFDLGEKYSP